VAGLLAGIAAGTFHLAVAEPLIDEALRYEVASVGGGSPETSRNAQRFGLFVATALYGAAVGGVFGSAYPRLARRLRTDSVWKGCLGGAAAAFTSLWLVPFLKYPPSPPGVGDPSTIGRRSVLYLVMLAVSVLGAVAAWVISGRLSDGGIESHRHRSWIAAGYAGVIFCAYLLLPSNEGQVPVPASLVWNFRLVSAAGQILLWGLLGVGFALLSLRAASKT
jgi:hypothetical protein